jgi:hypothetical protein
MSLQEAWVLGMVILVVLTVVGNMVNEGGE